MAGPIWAQSVSQARIVRLSFAEGAVSVQRPEAEEWAQAPVNTPLQEGFKLSTGENSYAEVEFEDASTVRLGQLTLLEFTQLALAPTGGKITHLTLHQGYATFHIFPAGTDVDTFDTPLGNLTPQNKAMFRVDIDQGAERVEVFKGSVNMSSYLGAWTLAKNQVLELQPGADQPGNLSEGITEDAWDAWVEQREGRAPQSPGGASPKLYSANVTDLLYGWNDLSSYGMWSNLPGYGYGWVPSVPPGWTPYTVGRWGWYPGYGYTWISFEPWGWLPYHYGYWNYFPGMGWGWFPNSFGMWSPAMVNWYTGPGWVGWVPQGNAQGTNACAPGQLCGAVVGVEAFQNGATVNRASILPRDPTEGQRINGPQIPPGRSVILPGPVAAPPGAPAGARAPANQPAGGAVVRGVVTAPDSAAVFDPAEGRYVQSRSARPVGSGWPSFNAPGATPPAGGAAAGASAVGSSSAGTAGAAGGKRPAGPSTAHAASTPAERSISGASGTPPRPAGPPKAQSGDASSRPTNPSSSNESKGEARSSGKEGEAHPSGSGTAPPKAGPPPGGSGASGSGPPAARPGPPRGSYRTS